LACLAESILGGGSVGNSQILYQIPSLHSDRAVLPVSTQIIRDGLPFAVQVDRWGLLVS